MTVFVRFPIIKFYREPIGNLGNYFYSFIVGYHLGHTGVTPFLGNVVLLKVSNTNLFRHLVPPVPPFFSNLYIYVYKAIYGKYVTLYVYVYKLSGTRGTIML